MLAIALLLASVQLLDFLSFHHLFGPWAVIIGKLMVDLGRFLVILLIFVFGFSMYVAAIYNPLRPIYSDANNLTVDSESTGYPPAGQSLHQSSVKSLRSLCTRYQSIKKQVPMSQNSVLYFP